MQTTQQESLAPTHVVGFPVSQNEDTLTESTGYDFGWDRHFARSDGLQARRQRGNRHYRADLLIKRKGSSAGVSYPAYPFIGIQGRAHGAGDGCGSRSRAPDEAAYPAYPLCEQIHGRPD